MLDILKPLAELEEKFPTRTEGVEAMSWLAQALITALFMTTVSFALIMGSLWVQLHKERIERELKDAQLAQARAKEEIKTTPKGGVCPTCLQALPEKR